MISLGNDFAGKHLIIDATFSSDSAKRKLNSVKFINKFLSSLTNEINMTLAVPPVSFKYPINNKFVDRIDLMISMFSVIDEKRKKEIIDKLKEKAKTGNAGGNGVSGTAIWVESHCALHSWTEVGYLSIDMFSCNSFDVKKALDFTKRKLDLDEIYWTELDRRIGKSICLLNEGIYE